MRAALSALVVGVALVVAAPAGADEPVEVDQEAIVAPAAEDTPTPEPTPTAVPGPSSTAAPAEPTAAAGNNASMQARPLKQREARDRCIANPSRLLATGGSERVDDQRSWAWLPFLIAAV